MSVGALDSPLDAGVRSAAEAQADRSHVRRNWQLLSPAMVVIGVFGILPLFIALTYSFLEADTYGGVRWTFSIEAYVQLLFERDIFDDTLAFNSAYIEIFYRSFLLASFSTFAALVLGFPTAYFMATRPESQRDLWVFLITIPFWTNLLIRTFSMQLIIRDEGLVNVLVVGSGLVEKPLEIIYTDFAIGLGLIYAFLPFMVLPIYAALERLDFRLVEAGFDLYANGIKGSDKFMDADMLAAPEIIMPAGAPDPDFVPPCDEQVVDLYNKIWTNLKK